MLKGKLYTWTLTGGEGDLESRLEYKPNENILNWSPRTIRRFLEEVVTNSNYFKREEYKIHNRLARSMGGAYASSNAPRIGSYDIIVNSEAEKETLEYVLSNLKEKHIDRSNSLYASAFGVSLFSPMASGLGILLGGALSNNRLLSVGGALLAIVGSFYSMFSYDALDRFYNHRKLAKEIEIHNRYTYVRVKLAGSSRS